MDVNRLPENGYIGERTSIDAFGLRRTADWKAISLSSLYTFKSLITERGYTGHEQLDAVVLIHMNGRVYDPAIGRFISADPIIQAPGDLQSYNRYSYVFNNPLTLTDPSGFSAWTKFRDKVLKPVAGAIFTGGLSLHVKLADKGLREFGRFARKNQFVAEAVQIGGCAAVTIGTGGAGAAGCGVITGAVTYGVTDGDTNAAVKAGAIAFVQADIANYIGHGSGLGKVGMVVAHGGLGGFVSVAQGGQFGSGFAAGAFGKSVTLGLSGTGLYAPGANGGFANDGVQAMAARTAVAAIAGGIGSELSGGQFANGAVTAAMQHLFNAEHQGLEWNLDSWLEPLEIINREWLGWWTSNETLDLRNGIKASVSIAAIPYKNVERAITAHDLIEASFAAS